MTRAARHIVRRVVLELDSTAPPADAPRHQARVAELCRRRLAGLLDRCLTEFSDPDTLYRIDRLECEIPDIDMEQLDSEWTNKVEDRIRETLREALRDAGLRGDAPPPYHPGNTIDRPSISGEAPLAGASVFDLLIHFLQTGLLPWWAGTTGNRTVQQAVETFVQTSEWPALLFQHIVMNSLMRQRLINHTNDAVLITFCQRLAGAHFAAGLERFLAGISPFSGTGPALRRRFWEAVFVEIAAPGSAGMPADGANLRKEQAYWEGLYRRIATPEGSGKETDTLLAPAMPRSAQGDKPVERRNEPTPNAPDFDDSERLYIDNAGVVLIGPYLPKFWEQLGWVADNRFNDPETAWLAVQMIQFLCDGQSETPPEYLLALPKILCGFRPDALFEPPRPLNEEEMAAGETLLEAVLEHVPGLGLRTTGALRGSFLLRKGVLRSGDFQWLLHVEKETYDIVLQKVPWGFQVLKFSWMETAVFVEWEV